MKLDEETLIAANRLFGFPVDILEEGAAKILIPKSARSNIRSPSKSPVFYNPAMVLNRDIAVAVVQVFQKLLNRNITAAEPLAGCGVRGIRLAKEVRGIAKVFLNDINPEAIKVATFNVKLNSQTDLISLSNEDANLFLARFSGPHRRFDYVDIDPFGSPAPYIDSVIRALRDGGIIAITATDLATLCGVYPKTAFRRYGGYPLRTEYSRELAVRLVCSCLASIAAKYDVGVKILLSYGIGHYIRIYATSRYGARYADKSLNEIGFIAHCFNCLHREVIKNHFKALRLQCPECGSIMRVAGPLWIGRICEEEFCGKVRDEVENRDLKGKNIILKLLSKLEEEADAPTTYYEIDKICDKMNLSVPKTNDVIEELRKDNLKAAITHFSSKGVKTDASVNMMRDAIKRALTRF
ncbi:MAG: tRNA (guanine(10)-N(2))-dimethyltransferase [Nitrososphaerota archaeon]|nr:tRNA (guanine(10)-N(2))-dimethyltransferase [Candidatus Bathyarchaeota archaeon]MDW8048848.1 tRNA (guanine(10)-N(2))-dimethyltransferase [Nitrososphaerota archaeon]